MPELSSQSDSVSEIDELVGSLRSRIRKIVILDGLAWMLFGVIILFWIGWLVDYLPVRFGYSEQPAVTRVVWLMGTGMMMAWVLYRRTVRKLIAPFSDASMAMLIERKYPEFQDSLITTVTFGISGSGEQHESSDVTNAMLRQARSSATKLVPQVDLRRIINPRPLNRAIGWAVLALISWGILASLSPSLFGLALSRLYLISSQPWPRQVRLELVSIEPQSEESNEVMVELRRSLMPSNGVLRVPRGASLKIEIRAQDNPDDTQVSLPEICWFNYRYMTGPRSRGSQPFTRIGTTENRGQTYSLTGNPIENLLNGMKFDISGGDDRIGPFTLEVVDLPFVKQTKLHLQFPDYLKQNDPVGFSDRTIDWTGQASLPVGTQVTIDAEASRPLQTVYTRTENDPLSSMPVDGSSFSFTLTIMDQRERIEFFVCDQDSIVNQLPYVVALDPIMDQPPEVKTRLVGIGTAVTPDVMIPISGKIEDDYRVKNSWVQIEIGEQTPLEESLPRGTGGTLATTIDFRQRRDENGDAFELKQEVGQKLALVVFASDFDNISATPHLGKGDRYELDVVTPDQLLRLIEQQEVGQRRRLEQVYRELSEVTTYLQRTRVATMDSRTGTAEPGDRSEAEPEPAGRGLELRRLFSQRAILQVEKSAQEVLGSADAFENLRMQLINNRITGTGREQRFATQVISPLSELGAVQLAQLREQIAEIETLLRRLEQQQNPSRENGVSALDPEINLPANPDSMEEQLEPKIATALRSADQALLDLESILNELIKYETQNELLDIVRQMIEKQQQLLQRTREERQKQAFDGLLDDLQ